MKMRNDGLNNGKSGYGIVVVARRIRQVSSKGCKSEFHRYEDCKFSTTEAPTSLMHSNKPLHREISTLFLALGSLLFGLLLGSLFSLSNKTSITTGLA